MNAGGMREIIEWLISIELMARDYYADAAAYFIDDKEFAKFLKRLSEDEEYHRTIMGQAFRHLQNGSGGVRAEIRLDEAVRRTVETPLLEGRAMLAGGTLTREGMMEGIVHAEYSEWNTIFLYVIDSLKEEGREFQHAASRLERHKTEIARRCNAQASCAAEIEKFRTLPSLWKNHILVVDDSGAILRFLRAVCVNMGIVDTAQDGMAALEKTRANYYDLIISDIEMPVMDGISFFMGAEKLDPGIGTRFLFLSGALFDERLDFLRGRGIGYLEKPATVTAIYEAASKILA